MALSIPLSMASFALRMLSLNADIMRSSSISISSGVDYLGLELNGSHLMSAVDGNLHCAAAD